MLSNLIHINYVLYILTLSWIMVYLERLNLLSLLLLCLFHIDSHWLLCIQSRLRSLVSIQSVLTALISIQSGLTTFSSIQSSLKLFISIHQVHAEIRRMWMRKKSLRRDSVALTRSFGLSSVRKTSFRSTRPIPGSANGRTNNNHAPNVTRSDLHLTRAYSDSSSDVRSDDWLTRVKRRTLGIFQKTKSNSSSEVIDTRYDFDGIPDIDSDNYALNHGVSVADRDHSFSDKNEYYDTEKWKKHFY